KRRIGRISMLGARMAPLYTRPAECGQVLPSLANARRAARLIEQRLMQVDVFAEATGTASGEAPVQLLVLLQDASSGGAKVGLRAGQQIGQRRARQVLGRQRMHGLKCLGRASDM